MVEKMQCNEMGSKCSGFCRLPSVLRPTFSFLLDHRGTSHKCLGTKYDRLGLVPTCQAPFDNRDQTI